MTSPAPPRTNAAVPPRTNAAAPPPANDAAAGLLPALVAAAAMTAQLVSGKATRDAFYLSHHAASSLPRVIALSSVVSVVAVVAASWAMAAFSPRRVVSALVAAGGGLFVAEWALAPARPGLASTLLYVHMATVGTTAMAGFWSLVNERFDPHAARQVVARLGVAGTVGGLVGSLVAWRVSAAQSGRAMLLVLGAMSVCALAGVVAVGRGVPARAGGAAGAGAGAWSALGSGPRAFRELPYLRHMAALVTAVALASTRKRHIASSARLGMIFSVSSRSTSVL